MPDLRVLGALALTVALTLTGGCASTTESGTGSVDIAPGVMLELPERPPFGPEANVIQLGQATYRDHATAFQAVISSRPDAMTLIMTLPSGPRVMSFTWTTGALKTKLEPIAPKGLSADHMLADILVIYGRPGLLQHAIHGAELVLLPDGSRSIVRNGQELIRVTRPPNSPSNPWIGRSVLENKVFGYRLSIESQALGAN
jgi:hypothetical protein